MIFLHWALGYVLREYRSKSCYSRGDSPQKGGHGELLCGCQSASSPAVLVLV